MLPAGSVFLAGKHLVASVMCLGLSDVRDLKPKHHLCDVFHNFGPCERTGYVFVIKL